MKKNILLIIAIICAGVLNAQDFYGEATYMSKTKMDTSFLPDDVSPQQKKRMEERMKSFGEKTFVLKFNRNESTYKEEIELSAPSQGGGRGPGNFMGTAMAGEKYKNLKDGEWIEQRDMMGKTFLIKDSIPKLDWKITGETRMIGQYQAIKATAFKNNNELDFSAFRRRGGNNASKEKKEEEVVAKEDLIEVVAWFTPQIPVQHGPAEYAGLPGLILEINSGNTTLLCSKIVVNPEDREEIKPATKGKETDEAEYNVLFNEKMKEMSERFGRGGGGGRGRG